jgi:gliding motility-associated-like protein
MDISRADITGTTCLQPTGSIGHILVTNITGQASYTWIDATGKTVGTSAALLDVPGGNYQLIFKDQGSCPAITTPAITIPNTGGEVQLTADKFASTDESCERANGAIQVLEVIPAAAGFSFAWIDDGTGQTIGSGMSVSGLTAGSYDLRATDATGCPQTVKTFQVADDPAPAIDLSAAVIAPDTCSQLIGSITGITVQGSSSFAFTWYDASGAAVAITKDLSSLGQGSYYLVVVDQNNCSSTGAAISVSNVTPLLTAPSYSDIVVLKGQTATLSTKDQYTGIYNLYAANPYNATAGTAAPPAQTNSSGDFTTAPLEADTTLYVVLVKGDCLSAAVAVTIKVLATQELIVPNAFTPNGDGHNDVFRVKNPQLVQSFSMTVFDRWGEKVFETRDPYSGWNGSRAGQPSPSGTYVWTIHYTDILGKVQNRRGTVIVVR